MSFANICDRCGKVIGDRHEDAEYMAIAVLVDGEVAYSLEDACDSCRTEFARAIDAFARPVREDDANAMPAEKAPVAPPRDEEGARAREAAEEKPPAPQEASNRVAPERPAHAAVDSDSLPNAVVRRFPLPIPEV